MADGTTLFPIWAITMTSSRITYFKVLLAASFLTLFLVQTSQAQSTLNVNRKFAKKVTVNVTDEGIEEFLNQVSREHKVSIELDKTTLTEEGFSPDDTFSLSLKEVSLFTVVSLASHSVGLTCYPKGNGLIVTTAPAMMRDFFEKRYNYPFLRVVNFDPDSIPDTLQHTTTGLWEEIMIVSPESGLRVGRHAQSGPFSIHVLQSWEVHKQIGQVFIELESIVRGKGQYIGTPPEQAIMKALQKRTEQAADETPLDDYLNNLADETSVNFWIDQEALSDEGIDSNVAITLTSGERTIFEHLTEALNAHSLVPYTEGEVVKITTALAEKELMLTKVYDVRKQVRQLGSVDAVRDVIQKTAGTGKWMDINQEGGDMSAIGPLLVIMQPRSGHHKIADILK